MLNRAASRASEFASRYTLGTLMIVLLVTVIFYSVFDLCFAPSYLIGDWLINYTQGFVRRGLMGQIILLLGHALHIPLPWMAVIIQIAIYSVFLYGVYRLAAPLRRNLLWYCLLLSPATLPFMILNPGNGCRKEVLLFAALPSVILLTRRGLSALALSLSIGALFAVMMLSHGAMFCCLPYFFAAIAVVTRDLKYMAKVSVGPFALAGLMINLARLYPGNMAVAMGICRSVGGRWINIDDTRDLCAGAIRHLSWTVEHSRSEELQNLHFWPLYAVLAILSFAPHIIALVRMYRRDHLHFEVKVIASAAVLCALTSAPLFYLTIDWGRWIHMQAVCLLVVILAAAHRAGSFQPSSGTARSVRIPRRALLVILAFLYCTCWTLPIYGGFPVRRGYLEVPLFFRHEFRFLHRIHAWQTIDRGW
ncbi:MAG TPA: hypothetical protein VGM11_09905 [Acidobacteriaceae bacterium]